MESENAGFRCHVEREGGGDLLVLAGRIDLEAASRIHREASQLAAASRDVKIDWSGAEHVCAGAIQVLLALRAALAARNGSLAVAADHPGVRSSLQLAGLSECFPLERDCR